MTNSLVASITEMLSPEIIGKLATASGLDRYVANEAVNTAVPAILNSIADSAAKPGGARKLLGVLNTHSTDLDFFNSNLIDPAQAATSGNGILSSLLGNRTPNILASGIANFLGVGANPVQMVLGLLTPLVLGGLQQVQRARGLDSDGLAQMLVEQRSEIANAIPAGLSGYLRKSGLLDEGARPREAARPDGGRRISAIATKPRGKPDVEKSVSWPYWMLAIAALGSLLWALLPHQDDAAVETADVSNVSANRFMLPQHTSGPIVFIERPKHDWKSVRNAANEFVNEVIYSAQGEALGTVRELLIESDGKAAAAVISVGRNLGIGDKAVAVPFAALRTKQHEGARRIVIDLASDALQSAPQYQNIPASSR